MASTGMPPDKLFALAKQHLGLPSHTSATAVPNFYLAELAEHLRLYPHDTHFRVTLQPRTGYGTLTCLENGCKRLKTYLGSRSQIPDGGKKDGFGSLSAYRFHIAHHPTHKTDRRARVKEQGAAKKHASATSALATHSSNVTIKKEFRTIELSDDDLKSTPSTPTFAVSKATRQPASGIPRTALSTALVKSEVPASIIPLKRQANFPSPSAIKTESVEDIMHSNKRPKIEPPKTPLASVNRNMPYSTQPLPKSSPSIQMVDDSRTQLRDIQTQLSAAQTTLDRLQRKPDKSKADLTKIALRMSEVQRLRQKKDEVHASIPSMSPTKMFVKLEPSLPDPNLPVFPKFSYPPLEHSPVTSGPNILPIKYGDEDNNSFNEDDMDLDVNFMNRISGAVSGMTPLAGPDHQDENGDFYGRGRDTFVGPRAKADDIDKFLVEAGNAELFDGNASLDIALQRLGLTTQYQLLPGMEIALMPHQTIGVAWMLEKEQSKFRGGSLCDEMGLGKTIQMIAVMVKNQSDDLRCKTNLIIAPTALLDQWKLEIEMKTNNMKCLIYHGSSKPKRRQDILKYDIVLTTYATVAFEWPDYDAEEKAKAKKRRKKNRVSGDFIESDSDDRPATRRKRKELGLLFHIDFFRIILDEAQNIRNRKTRNSRAVTALDAKYRWCLTGTPIINGLQDAYSYVRFLKIRPWYDWDEFNRHIARLEKKNPSLAVTRLQAIFGSFMMRRMKDSMLDGKRLVELPEKKIELVRLEFTAEERDVYKMVEARSQATFNRFLRAGTVLKNYHQVLVLLLRLRQVCSHPSLIQEDGVAFIAPDELEDDNVKPELRGELARARQLVSPDFVRKMKENLKQAALRRIAAEKESVDATAQADECPLCMEACTDAVVTQCSHIFCRECIVDIFNTPPLEDVTGSEKLQVKQRPCPYCHSAISADKVFSLQAFEPSDADLAGVNEDGDVEMQSDTDVKGKSKAKMKRATGTRRRAQDSDVITIDSDDEETDDDDDDDDISDFIVESDEDEEEKDVRRALKMSLRKRTGRAIVIDLEDEFADAPQDAEAIFGARSQVKISKEQIKLMPRFLPSTKMKHMMDLLLSWAKEFPDDKTLVVSQWTQSLSLVSDYLTEKGILHVKYQGDMNRTKRDQAVRVFMSRDKARVMLMSLKCGGAGLNLTRSNRVISLDLGWSQAIEAQAFDRVHRLGQTKPVHVHRLVITDTVEDRVLAMQERKQNLADGSLGEGNGKKIGRLSVRELANLFGLDHRGRVIAQD